MDEQIQKVLTWIGSIGITVGPIVLIIYIFLR